MAYAYDLAGNRTALFTTSNGQQTTNSTTRFTFDALNRLETVTDPDGGVARYTYDPANNVQRVALPNGTFRTNAYDALNRVTSIAHVAPTGVFSSFRYTLGPTGHRLAVQENTGRQVRYDYDALSRLVRESVFSDPSGPNPTNSFGYDAVGNRLYFTNTLDGVTAYGYDANDQLLTESLGGATTRYAYDDNGNTLSRSNATQSAAYTWDAQNRLVGARIVNLLTSTATNLSYQYDDDGIRVAALVDNDETRYLIDANRPFAQVVEEWTSINHQPSTLTASYTHGPHHLISQSRAGTRAWYHADGLGSTRALTGQSGSPTDRYHFDAYGRLLSQSTINPQPTANDYLFAGEQRDRNLGLDYLRARYLNFNAGRFYGRDPFEGLLNNPASKHPFGYALDNPANIVDRNGKFFGLIDLVVTLSLIEKIYVKHADNLLTGYIRVRRVANNVLEPAFTMQEVGYVLLSHDVPCGEDFVVKGRQLVAIGSGKIVEELSNVYIQTGRDLLTLGFFPFATRNLPPDDRQAVEITYKFITYTKKLAKTFQSPADWGLARGAVAEAKELRELILHASEADIQQAFDGLDCSALRSNP